MFRFDFIKSLLFSLFLLSSFQFQRKGKLATGRRWPHMTLVEPKVGFDEDDEEVGIMKESLAQL